MLPPACNDADSSKGQPQPLDQRQRQGSTHFRRQSAIKARCRTEPRRRSSSTTGVKPEAGGGNGRNKERKTRRKKSSGRGRRRGGGSRGGARSLVNPAAWAEREGGGAGWSLSEEERIGVVTDLVELFQQVDHNGDQVRGHPLVPAEVFRVHNQTAATKSMERLRLTVFFLGIESFFLCSSEARCGSRCVK